MDFGAQQVGLFVLGVAISCTCCSLWRNWSPRHVIYLFEFKLATGAGDNSFDICLPASSLTGYRCGGYNTFSFELVRFFVKIVTMIKVYL